MLGLTGSGSARRDKEQRPKVKRSILMRVHTGESPGNFPFFCGESFQSGMTKLASKVGEGRLEPRAKRMN